MLDNVLHIFSGDQSGHQTGPTAPAHLLCSRIVVMRLHCPAGTVRDVSGWQRMLLQTLYVTFSVNGGFTGVHITYVMDTNCASYHHRCWLLNFELVTIWMVLFLSRAKNTVSKNYTKFGPKDTFPVQQSISDEPGSERWAGCCWRTSFTWESLQLWHQTVFTDSWHPNCCWAHAGIRIIGGSEHSAASTLFLFEPVVCCNFSTFGIWNWGCI